MTPQTFLIGDDKRPKLIGLMRQALARGLLLALEGYDQELGRRRSPRGVAC
jgi:hypothetical protein